jgi:hypothetical protein
LIHKLSSRKSFQTQMAQYHKFVFGNRRNARANKEKISYGRIASLKKH